MKAPYTISLDKEKVDEIKIWLDKRGLTFSGYLNSLIDEQLNAIALFSPMEKNKISGSTVIKMASRMAKELTKELKDGKKTSKE